MNFDEAKQVLGESTRHELRDHAFGDMEITWTKDEKVIATGYFSSSTASVTIMEDETSFENAVAHVLKSWGTLGEVGRNDETGPDEYVEGAVMPGLTLEGVRNELTGEET